jgi:hypothetical protein
MSAFEEGRFSARGFEAEILLSALITQRLDFRAFQRARQNEYIIHPSHELLVPSRVATSSKWRLTSRLQFLL